MIHTITLFIVFYYLSIALSHMQYKFEKNKLWRRIFLTSPLWGLLGFIILPIYFLLVMIRKICKNVEMPRNYKKAVKEEIDERRTR